jgi:hypothetical protein
MLFTAGEPKRPPNKKSRALPMTHDATLPRTSIWRRLRADDEFAGVTVENGKSSWIHLLLPWGW